MPQTQGSPHAGLKTETGALNFVRLTTRARA